MNDPTNTPDDDDLDDVDTTEDDDDVDGDDDDTRNDALVHDPEHDDAVIAADDTRLIDQTRTTVESAIDEAERDPGSIHVR